MRKLIAVAFFILLGSVASQAQVSSSECDSALWSRVYSPYRFAYPVDQTNTKEPPHRCVKIRGKIDHVTEMNEEGDGDIHISVVPDNEHVLAPGQTFLVLEIVCADNTPSIGPAKRVCKGYQNPPRLSYNRVGRFRKGQRVEIVGELVTDYYHRRTGWREIHPVSRIDPIN
jgi:hypothetical protein